MDKQKQIEEMAKVIKAVKYEPFNDGVPTYSVGSQMQDFVFYLIGEALYNAGYRKIPENAVVLTREERQRYLAYKIIEPQIRGCLDREVKLEKQVRELGKELNLAKSVLSYDDERPLEKWAEHLRKETVEKFAERLKDALFDLGNVVTEKDIDEIAKELGVGNG